MPREIKTVVEKNIWKIVYPTGTVRYRVEFSGKDTSLYSLKNTLKEAQDVKKSHIEKFPSLLGKTLEQKKEGNISRASVTKVANTQFIGEYNSRPGTYSIRINRAKKYGGGSETITATVVGLSNARKKEKELIKQMEKLTGRDINVFVSKPSNPLYRNALKDVSKEMKTWSKKGYYPDNLLVKISDKYNFPHVKGEGANRQLVRLVQDNNLIDKNKLKAVGPKYIEAVGKYKQYKGDKTKVGVKKTILEELGMDSKGSDVGTFRRALKTVGIHVNEDIKLEGEQVQRGIDAKLKKLSSSNIEGYLSGSKMGSLIVNDKKGSLLDKMHLGDKTALIRVGEMGYGSSKLNQQLGGGFRRTEGAERHRTSLNKHINRIVEKYKGNPDAMYEISSGPDSFDQKKFKLSLEKEFGKSKGVVPLKQYLDKIINTEVQLMGYATDGLITARRIDPITLERMAPSSNLSGSRTLQDYGKLKSNMSLQDLGLEKQAAGRQQVTPLLEDLNISANLGKQSADLNIKNFKLTPARMNSIITSIDKMLKEGLLDRATAGKYETISKLAEECTLLRADGGRIAFASGGPCAEAQQAVKNLNQEEIIKIGSNIDDAMQGPMGKLRDASRGVLNIAKKGGRFGAFAAAGAATAGLVKEFRNDDPSTYLSNEDQQKNMLIDMLTQPVQDPSMEPASTAFGDAQLPAIGAVTAAGMVPGGAELYRQRTGSGVRKGPLGGPRLDADKLPILKNRVSPARAFLGPLSGVLGKGLATTGTPLGMLALEPLYIGQQIADGDSAGEIATNPLNYLGPAFAGSLSKEATRFAGPKMANIMRLGISPTMLKTVSRRFGLPGLGISAGISGYEMYQNKKAGRGIFDDG